jgi:hypothetical protein
MLLICVQVQAVTSQLGGSAHKRGLVNPYTGRIVLYTYRDIILTFTVKVSININYYRRCTLLWIRGMIAQPGPSSGSGMCSNAD